MSVYVFFDGRYCEIKKLFLYSSENNPDFKTDLRDSLKGDPQHQKHYQMPNFDWVQATYSHTQDLIDAAVRASELILGHDALSFAATFVDGSVVELTTDVLNTLTDDAFEMSQRMGGAYV